MYQSSFPSEQAAEHGDGECSADLAAVVNTPLAMPAWWSGTLLSNTAVTGGIVSGPARPTRIISSARAPGSCVGHGCSWQACPIHPQTPEAERELLGSKAQGQRGPIPAE